ncbi:MAG: GH116 family glycosyl hydrolase [Bacteroidales bacterium]
MSPEAQDPAVPRRDFIKQSVVTAGAIGATVATDGSIAAALSQAAANDGKAAEQGQAPATARTRRKYNAAYEGANLARVAFPMGGIGAGMICLEGTGALSHFSLRNKPEVFNEPCLFAAIAVKGDTPTARVLEGPVPSWKLFGPAGTANGASGKTYGLPRLRDAAFEARFPFATVRLSDAALPLTVDLTGWSPFEPGDADNASLPVAGLEYRFTNSSRAAVEAVFSFNARNFMATSNEHNGVRRIEGGFVLFQQPSEKKPSDAGAFSATVADERVKVNASWFRGGWWDPLTMAWNDVQAGAAVDRAAVSEGLPSPGASLFVPFTLRPGESRTMVIRLAWYVGTTDQRYGADPDAGKTGATASAGALPTFKPWYAARFADIDEVSAYWATHYGGLRTASRRFAECFADQTLPPEVLEAVAANLAILKSPTCLRQADGRMWCWEGCADNNGCCSGSCTHVWNYAQALPHLFPSLERTLRETEFDVSQDERGHQAFRSALPIRPIVHDFHAAADGQLGGIMKVHREWRISGDTEWLRRLWPKVRRSMDYAVDTWDPSQKGVVEEPHHNTYDIEFWGADGMCTSFYLGALEATIRMGTALGEDVAKYKALCDKGTALAEQELFDGEYFIQQIRWEGLRAKSPLETQSYGGEYSAEAIALLKKEGPKYQYGAGCLSDGVLGAWIAAMCGIARVLDPAKVTSHLRAVHRHNLKKDLSDHSNPQRPSYACGAEGGLLLCTWPKGGKLSLPFVYSDEVWTGIEYQVASHLMLMGLVEQGLEIVRVARDRYDGRVRNPFNEYECGHWYARAMSSYGLLQGLTGARYDAVDETLYLEPTVKGDFRAFLSTATGYGTVGVKNGKPFLEVRAGTIAPREIKYHART